jgi:hypothetical protein
MKVGPGAISLGQIKVCGLAVKPISIAVLAPAMIALDTSRRE